MLPPNALSAMIAGAVLAVPLLSALAFPSSPPPAAGQAGCFEATESEGTTVFGPMREKALLWDRFLLGYLVRRIAGQQLERYREEQGIPLQFMLAQEDGRALPSGAREQLRRSGTAGRLQSHPCGTAVQAFVKDLGSHGLAEWLLPDWVLEFNRKGKVISRWDIPLNAPVRAVQEDSIWVSWDPQPLCSGQSLDVKAYLVIGTDGSLRAATRPGLISEGRKIKCPRSPDIPPSEFLVCESIRDLKTRKTRRLAYQLPCE
ncbi:MAG: hypothetical protein OXU26_17900 [Acidobacteriota bacterium]|nr:hypothetical protein [Acidobacteriota bacterium]